MNLSNFGPLSVEAEVFQVWFLASRAPHLDPKIPPYARALEIFGDLSKVERQQRLDMARHVLAEEEDYRSGRN